MKAEHFSEIVETICCTKNMTYKKVAELINVHYNTINNWKKNGVPVHKSPLIKLRLKHVLWDVCDE